MVKKIFSVGFEVPGPDVVHIGYYENQSLLDADIVLFQPGLGDTYLYPPPKSYLGLPRLEDETALKIHKAILHWHTELKAAFENGKTIFVFLAAPRSAYVESIETKLFDVNGLKKVDSYAALPISVTTHAVRGSAIIPAGDISYLKPYWNEFSKGAEYQVVIEGPFTDILLKTKQGNRIVGAALNDPNAGTFILLPPIQYDEEEYTREPDEEDEEGQEYWTEEAIAFGKRLVSALVAVSEAIQHGSNATPAPSWTEHAYFGFQREAVLRAKIATNIVKTQKLHEARLKLEMELSQAGTLRRLLYETGHPLEKAILDALRLMGFNAETYSDGESEFDSIFTSPEGRFLGEAEGKDNKPINIDKLSQLGRNIQEDYEKEVVTEYAKGVLFGNPYRLLAPNERAEGFTEKCIAGAKRLSVALVLTVDLFIPAKYLKEHPNRQYAKLCREAIKKANGELVKFPDPPVVSRT